MLNRLKAAIGRRIASYLEKQTTGYVTFAVVPQERLRAALRPGDVLLVEGDRRISAAIKYLTHSTWSHSAMFMGDNQGDLIEADLTFGVRYVDLSHYAHLNVRICRPVGLTDEDLNCVLGFLRGAIGRTYDLKNVLDLLRFLLPQPPVPRRWRRRMLALGSGDPTRAICSTLIAEAFSLVRYPILPDIRYAGAGLAAREILHIRHHSLYTPRDFDLSPYFAVIKPTIEAGFDYRTMTWSLQARP
ncbi:MAG: lipo-like protein [Paracoccaceae bacterium]